MLRSKIGLKIIAVISVSVILTVGSFGYLAYVSAKTYVESSTTERYQKLVYETITHIDHSLFERERSALLLAESHTPRHFLTELYEIGEAPAHPVEGVNEDLDSFGFGNSLWSFVSLIDQNAVIQASSEREMIGKTFDGINSQQLNDVLLGNSYISDFNFDTNLENARKLYVFPIRKFGLGKDENIFVGALVAYLPLENIEEIAWSILKQIPNDLGIVGVTLISKDNITLASRGDINYRLGDESEEYLYDSPVMNDEKTNIQAEKIISQETGKMISVFHKRSEGYKTSLGFGGTLALELDTQSLFKHVYDLTLSTLPYNILSVLLVGIFCIVLLQFIIIKPMRAIEHAIDQIHNGNVETRAKVFAQDEIGEMAHSFNDMTSQLYESNIILEREVYERTNELELEKTSLEARVAERTEELQQFKDSLEQAVVERTKELNEKVDELESINKLMVDREIKMIALKEELKKASEKNQSK